MIGRHPAATMGHYTAAALTPQITWLMPLAGLLAVFGLRLRQVPRLTFVRQWADNLAIATLLCLSILQIAVSAFSPFLYFRF